MWKLLHFSLISVHRKKLTVQDSESFTPQYPNSNKSYSVKSWKGKTVIEFTRVRFSPTLFHTLRLWSAFTLNLLQQSLCHYASGTHWQVRPTPVWQHLVCRPEKHFTKHLCGSAASRKQSRTTYNQSGVHIHTLKIKQFKVNVSKRMKAKMQKESTSLWNTILCLVWSYLVFSISNLFSESYISS